MTSYAVYATRWDDPGIIEQIPARGLSFTMPISDHGECAFTATVEPGLSTWRAAVAPPLSGILVARDAQPIWAGWMDRPERQTGPRTFTFQAREWGAFFDRCPAKAGEWFARNDHELFLEQVAYVQGIAGQDVQVQTVATLGASYSDRVVSPHDRKHAGAVMQEIGNAAGGPEWYFGVAGSLAAPVRQLVLADRLGTVDPAAVLMYVEDTAAPTPYSAPATLELLSDLFPAGTTVPRVSRRGGNAVAALRERDPSGSATVVIGVGDGVDAAQVLSDSTEADRLLANGWPRMTQWVSHSGVRETSTINRHALADLRAVAGVSTRYNLVTLDGDPDWTQVPRGSSVRVILDTDVYALPRPWTFETRVQSIRVDVPDDGDQAQIQWDLREVLEVTL